MASFVESVKYLNQETEESSYAEIVINQLQDQVEKAFSAKPKYRADRKKDRRKKEQLQV